MLASGFGGAERSFVDTAIALSRRGHEVQAICHHKFSRIDLLTAEDGLRVDTVRTMGEWDFITPLRIASLLKDFGSQVVHTQLKRAAWHGSRGARKVNVPVVSKLHNYVHLKRYRYVDQLLCTTADQRRHVLDAGWPTDQVSVIPNFSRLEPVQQVKARSAGGAVRLLSYGRYVKKKGFDYLLRAFRLLLDDGVHAHLMIGGQGAELDSLRRLADELSLGPDVLEMGRWLDDVKESLDLADVFVLPSLDEPFGIVMLEAMARGVPIVSTKTKGPVEVLNEDLAYLVELASVDALYMGLSAAINDEAGTRLKASRALQTYRDLYYEDAVLPQIERVYQKLCDR